MKRILLTGGGTAGHVTANLALLPALVKAGYNVCYVGSHAGIERELVEPLGVPYYAIASGKLRRYLSAKNLTDGFRVVKGLADALRVMRLVKPDVVFSKGGFVTVPVVIAARMRGVPVVIHESDLSPGLANRIAYPFASTVCVNFPETLKRTPKSKGVHTGTPIREGLFAGDKIKAVKLCGFSRNDYRPVVLVTGGSQGSVRINETVRGILPKLLETYRCVHLCGKGNLSGARNPGYAEFEYLSGEMADIFALADIVVSRAGANTLFELLALHKPHLLIPLSREASRGDQIENAASFAGQGFSAVLFEKQLTGESLLEGINRLYADKSRYIARMEQWSQGGGAGNGGLANVLQIIDKQVFP